MPYVVSSDSHPSIPDVVYAGGLPAVAGERRFEDRQERATRAAFAFGGSFEVVLAGAAAVISVVGLYGRSPLLMAVIATIAIGGALLSQGSAVLARWRPATAHAAHARAERAEVIGGTTSEVLGGIAGIVLGILALATMSPHMLVAIAMIVYGGVALVSAAEQARLSRLAPDRDWRAQRVTLAAVETSSGAMVLAGLTAVTLGVLALLGEGPAVTFALISMLVLGIALLVTGGAFAARFSRR